MRKQDILILGGGPSGLSTALHLAQLAPELTERTLVIEKAHYPRPKLCAGGLVADAEIILQRLGLDVSEVPHVDADAAHFDFAGKGLKISMPKTHALRVIRRDEFDAWLAKKAREAGIEIQEGITVKSVRPTADGVTIETDQGGYHAKVVIGADGSNGITRRYVLPNAPVHTARVLEVLTPPTLVRGLAPDGTHKKDHAYFDFFPVPDGIAGYTWDFPTQLKGQPMRCWGIYDTNLLANKERSQLKEPLAAEMARQGFDLDDYELKGHPIRWFHPFNTFSAPHMILVGDAAGADSIFGEGISMALGYGKVAAQAIRDAFRKGDFTFRGYRRRILFSPLGQTLTIRTMITYILYKLQWEWFQKFFWRTFKPAVAAAAWILVLNWGKRMK